MSRHTVTENENITMLRLPEVMARTGLSRATIYCKANPKDPRYDASFPKRVKLSANASGWVESEVNQWLVQRIQQRNQAI